MNQHITPGYNGWTPNAKKIIGAINQREREKQYAEHTEERAELEYYEENNCFPRPMGYCGTETDAHFFER